MTMKRVHSIGLCSLALLAGLTIGPTASPAGCDDDAAEVQRDICHWQPRTSSGDGSKEERQKKTQCEQDYESFLHELKRCLNLRNRKRTVVCLSTLAVVYIAPDPSCYPPCVDEHGERKSCR